MSVGVAANQAEAGPSLLAEALDTYLHDAGLADALARLAAIDEWACAVGARVSEVTRPVEVRGDTLVVEVSSSAWINELAMMSSLILRRVNERMGTPQIGRLRFRLAEATLDEPRPVRGRAHGDR